MNLVLQAYNFFKFVFNPFSDLKKFITKRLDHVWYYIFRFHFFNRPFCFLFQELEKLKEERSFSEIDSVDALVRNFSSMEMQD